MGLDCSHDAFHGAYYAFNRLRQEVARAADGEAYSQTTHPGLFEFLKHSDCDGEISPSMCLRVASDLEELLPQVQALGSVAAGHILNRGGYVEVLRKFIAGCREAAAAGEPLIFS